MFTKYLHLISNLIDTIKTGKGNITFLDYLGVLGNTFLLILILCVIVVIAIGCIAGPKFTYGKMIGTLCDKMNGLLQDKKLDEVADLEAKIKKRKIVYYILLFAVYLPFVIPTFLYVLYLVFHI